jgi:hypothetical protein
MYFNYCVAVSFIGGGNGVAVSFIGGGNGVAVSFIGGGNGDKRRKPPTYNKSLTNLKNVFLLHFNYCIKYSSQCTAGAIVVMIVWQ